MAKKRFFQESELVFSEHPNSKRFIDLTDQVFDRLKVLGFAGQDNQSKSLWYCRCSCGNIAKIYSSNLIRDLTKSCGCLNIKMIRDAQTTHGHSKRGNISPEYQTWLGMLDRTQNPNNPAYSDYGARGITVCERWLKFQNFFEDMGKRPDGKTLDRYPDNNGDYCPENCRWANATEQGANKRNNVNLTYDGKTQNVSQWAVDIAISTGTLRGRLRRGWPVEKALTAIPKNRVVNDRNRMLAESEPKY